MLYEIRRKMYCHCNIVLTLMDIPQQRCVCVFFQVSILQYGCTTWTLTKHMEKKLDGNCTRMLRALLNKSWRQHSTKQQLYGHLPSISKTFQIRRTRHVGHS